MIAAARPLDERAVLVVDDEPAVCRMTARILRDAGLPALEAPDGEKAVSLLDRLGANAVRAVVSDVVMPHLRGDELARIMAKRWPTVPILLTTGQGFQLGEYRGPVLPKPFTPEALVAAVVALPS